MEDAAGYIVYYDGKFVEYSPEASFTPSHSDDIKLYSIAAINSNGCRGKIATLETTGIGNIGAEASRTEYYNLQGVRISGEAKGVVIKVTRNADGTVKREKIVTK